MFSAGQEATCAGSTGQSQWACSHCNSPLHWSGSGAPRASGKVV